MPSFSSSRVSFKKRDRRQPLIDEGALWVFRLGCLPAKVFCDEGILLKSNQQASRIIRVINKIENKIPVVSVSDRGKQIANYGTCFRIYTVDYEIRGDRGKILGKTIEVGNVP